MFNSKSNYVIAIFIVFVYSCKKSIDNTQTAKNENIEISDDTNINQSEPDFNYENLVGKTFLPVYQKEDGTYEYGGDITKEDDMGEDRIRFRKNTIKHLIPIEWQSYPIIGVASKEDWLELKLGDIEDKKTHFSNYFKYSKNDNLLKYCVVPNEDIEVFMDSAFIAKKEKPIIKKENSLEKYIVYKKHQIIFNNKKIEISIPFIEPHLNENGVKIFKKGDIAKQLEVKLLKKNEKSLLFVFGEGMCGACPNFSSLYDENGNNLSYRYSIRKGQESIKLISHGNDDEIFTDYGFTDRDVNIQINHKDTPTYIIKDWY
ncbi:hypothetical protein Celal_1674 [Cellulophaga algicola DSM 14237]|uniref:Lipoprotein n=1 Tax=Cellulophaga algicola (strain DSM 14237 / IC166 / ACAM 630) TaxID=688270 RepID=E6XBX9_CELAD|nr:hypothetical protein [Cellulophaga algicola]ADV48981.1 hypothetical protein Celal_1674 [Cellulophaga algicola DSM 14237]